MYKLIIAAAFVFIFVSGCIPKIATRKNHNRIGEVHSIKIISKENITTLSQGDFYFPKFTHDDSKIFFTTSNYNGIYFFNLKNHYFSQIVKGKSTGLNYCVSDNGEKIFFILKSQKNRKKFYSLMLKNLKQSTAKLIYSSFGRLSNPKIINDGIISFFENKKLKFYNIKFHEFIPPPNLKYCIITGRDDTVKIYRYRNSVNIIILPHKSIIWLDELNNCNEFIGYSVGKGLFLIYNNGKRKRFLGDFRAAKLSPTQNIIVYMNDIYSNQKLVSSDLWVTSIDTVKSFNITNTPSEIELNPSWSSDGKSIVYNTAKGEIKIINLQIEQIKRM